MSSQSPRRRWAESGDWEPVRPLITRMYKVEGRSLKEVMSVMEAQYQFLATPKMYKKRIKDWAIDKNLRSERPHAASSSPRTKQQRHLPSESQSSSATSPAVGAQEPSLSAVDSSSGSLVHNFQYGTRPPAEGAAWSGYHTPGTIVPSQQGGGQHWAVPSQSNSSPQSRQCSGQAGTSPSLSSIRDRFLAASDAIARHDIAVLFEILNPAYEAISTVPETETTQLLAVIGDLFRILSRRPNHQDVLRQLLQYVFALVPDSWRQNEFLSTDSRVLALLGRSGYAFTSHMPLDTAGGINSGSTMPTYSYGYYGQPQALDRPREAGH